MWWGRLAYTTNELSNWSSVVVLSWDLLISHKDQDWGLLLLFFVRAPAYNTAAPKTSKSPVWGIGIANICTSALQWVPLQTVRGVLAQESALVPQHHLLKITGLILWHILDISARSCRTGCLKRTCNRVLKFRLCWFLLICVCSFQFLMGNNIFLNQVLPAM